MKEFIYSGETLNNYPHGQGMILYNDNETFTGTWDKGLRVNTGVYNINQSTYEVEFKEGKICRLLNLDHRGSSEEIILTFKQPNYIKKGDYYEEIEEIQECTFKVINNKILNNGMPIKLIDIYDLVGEIVKIQSQKGKNILAFNHFTYEGRCLQNIPLGPGKLLLKDSFYIIGYFRGYSFSDTVKIVNNETELSFTENSGKLPTEVRLYYKDCDLNVLIYTENRSKVQFSIQNVRSMNNIKNILLYGANYSTKEIINIVMKFLTVYINFKHTASKISHEFNAIISSLNVNSNWLEYENTLKLEKNYHKYMMKSFLGKDFEDLEDDTNKLVQKLKYKDEGIYVGEVKGGQRNGLGSLIVCDQYRYRGYFKNDKFHGLGCFSNLEFKIKGIWNNGKLENVNQVIFLNL